jgi:hypothetical protein
MFFAVMAIRLVEFDQALLEAPIDIISRPVLAIAILIFPLFDTLRVFMLRAAKGMSPFNADRNHLHHCLLDLGFNHRQTVISLASVNIVVITLAVFTAPLGANYSFLIVIGVAFTLFMIPVSMKYFKK